MWSRPLDRVRRWGEALRAELPAADERTLRRSTGLILGGAVLLVFLLVLIPLPEPLFSDPYCTVLRDREGRLLHVRIADDHQWRFPPPDRLPESYVQAVLAYEDRRFFLHGGVDPLALVRAAWLNLREGRVVSGGSTITMQLARLIRKPDTRTLPDKVIEIWYALRLEWRYTKAEILRLYAAHAPFGGNIVGIEAACWRYFGHELGDLSWAEAAFLAVLPRDPADAFTPQGREEVRTRRNQLLLRLSEAGHIPPPLLQVSLAEPLPSGLHPFPSEAPHLLLRALSEGHAGESLLTTVDLSFQRKAARVVTLHHHRLAPRGIHNAAVLVVHLPSGEVRAYVGNTPEPDPEYGPEVDCVSALRSPGSTLKPFLYGLMMTEGLLLPHQLVSDVPVSYGGFSPRNFHRTYYGVVPADQALIESLNVPFTILLARYGYRIFYGMLERLGLRFPHPPEHYGLSLILGGIDLSLWDLAELYGGLGRIALGEGDRAFVRHRYLLGEEEALRARSPTQILDPAAVWYVIEAMTHLVRPENESGWEHFVEGRRVAWKTGTSWGQRDAWAVGITPEYLVAVWVGNADGRGNPHLLGARVAGPLLFDVLRELPLPDVWFERPVDRMVPVAVCATSGMRAGPHCPEVRVEMLPYASRRASLCTYHRLLHLDAEGEHQVDSSTYPVGKMRHEEWFVLPPLEAWYYKRSGHVYREPPPPLSSSRPALTLAYPSDGAVVYIPVDLDERREAMVCEAVHTREQAVLYWHLDGELVAVTRAPHQIAIAPPAGWHTLYVMDEEGFGVSARFRVEESGIRSREGGMNTGFSPPPCSSTEPRREMSSLNIIQGKIRKKDMVSIFRIRSSDASGNKRYRFFA
ncbi:penicillin-binding protein 1C [Spirochaeta thermophila DSM 6578]|uniref:peptidoglycan glycosyltransferase n=2 Tax=Winmispira thermophila TaxID=154 RepID=G0GBK1_WINT7|nr:penicillin-binding protein 1C [Spirochaeta thermophila DSM 6578]